MPVQLDIQNSDQTARTWVITRINPPQEIVFQATVRVDLVAQTSRLYVDEPSVQGAGIDLVDLSDIIDVLNLAQIYSDEQLL